MTHRSWALTLIACLLVSSAALAAPSERALNVFVNGRPVDRHGETALVRSGVAYIDAIRAVRTFDGLLTFGKDEGRIRVTIGERTMNFTVGSPTAFLEGMPIALPGAPFRANGDIYLPLRTIAMLGSSQVVVDLPHDRVLLSLGAGESFAPPTASPLHPEDSEDAQLSPAQALTFATNATTEGGTLHAQVAIKNTTTKPYRLAFHSGKGVAFVVSLDGTEVWNSSATVESPAPTSFLIDPLATRIVTADWPGYAKLPPGRVTLRVRLMTLIPLDIAPISIGVRPPPPSASH